MATVLDAPATSGHDRRVAQALEEIDNLRAALAWSRENDDTHDALELAAQLQPLRLGRGRVGEGLVWLKAALADETTDDAVWARARALAVAREAGDPALLVRALLARGCITLFDPPAARQYLAQAAELARQLDDSWRLSQALQRQAHSAMTGGDTSACEAAAKEGLTVAEGIGDAFNARQCRFEFACVHIYRGQLGLAADEFRDLATESTEVLDLMSRVTALIVGGFVSVYRGDAAAGRALTIAAQHDAAELGEYYQEVCYPGLVVAALAVGDLDAAWEASEASLPQAFAPVNAGINIIWPAQAALARGDLDTASRLTEAALASTRGSWNAVALLNRARLGIATDDLDAAVAAVRNKLGDNDFDAAWAEGAALPPVEAIAYAQRRRGERKRSSSGWSSLTPAERDVVRLVSDGLSNRDVASRLFVSPRTVQTHLSHVYAKLGLASRVQLVQEASRHV
jgi:DNA-binding CsgD family transcriptional regulator